MDGLVMDTRGLLEALVSIPSVTGEEGRIASFLAEFLGDAGVRVEVREVEPGRSNLLARVPGEGPPILCMGHLDTVPPGSGWETDPFSPRWEGERLTGLGSCDMKGGVAAMVSALVALLRAGKRREMWGLFTVGEEVNSIGARKALEDWLLGRDFQLLVVPEPTGLKMGIAEKGVLWIRFTLKGEGGHASMAKGPRALEEGCRLALDLVERVRKTGPFHSLLGASTAEITQFHGGWKTNVIPPHAVMEVDLRLVPGLEPETLIDSLESLVEGRGVEVELEIVNNRPPVESMDSPALEDFARAAGEVMGREVERVGLPYYSDISAVVPGIEVPFVLFGPGDPMLAHAPGEWVDGGEVETVARVLERLALL